MGRRYPWCPWDNLRVILFENPFIGVISVPYVLGIFALIGGIGAIISAFLIRPKT